jgi:hypothetical protein
MFRIRCIEQLPLFSPDRVVEFALVRTARPFRPGRNVGGAVKRDNTLTALRSRFEIIRVLMLSICILLVLCLFVSPTVFLSATQSPSDDKKPGDDTKKEEAKKDDVKKDDVRKNTPGMLIKPGSTVHIDVDLALVNVTVTDPFNRLVTGL